MKLPKVVEYSLISLCFSLPVAWLGLYAICLSDWWPWVCRLEHNYLLVTATVTMATFGPVALAYRERALRRARRGMYTRLVGGGQVAAAGWLRSVVHLAIEGEWPDPSHPALYDARSGWWVKTPVNGGTVAWVNRQEFYEWLHEVMRLRQMQRPGQSPISERLWEPVIGRVQWWARCKLLDEVGAVVYRTGSPGSRALDRSDVWGIMEDVARVREIEYQ